LATTLFGVLTGQYLRDKTRTPIERVAHMSIAGVSCVIVGWIWNAWFPINKSLWTSSYVFFTAGLALQFLALCYWLIDIKGYKLWTKPFVIFGVNAITLFVGTGIMAILMGLIKVPRADGTRPSVHGLIYDNVYASWLPPNRASLAFAISFVLLWLFFMWLLFRKNTIIKI